MFWQNEQQIIRHLVEYCLDPNQSTYISMTPTPIFTATPRMTTPLPIKSTSTSSTFVPEPSIFEHWIKSKKTSVKSPPSLPPRPKYRGIQRVFEIAHKSVIYTCLGVSVLIAGQLALWMVTGEGRQHREEAIAIAMSKHKESQPEGNKN